MKIIYYTILITLVSCFEMSKLPNEETYIRQGFSVQRTELLNAYIKKTDERLRKGVDNFVVFDVIFEYKQKRHDLEFKILNSKYEHHIERVPKHSTASQLDAFRILINSKEIHMPHNILLNNEHIQAFSVILNERLNAHSISP